MAIFGEVAQKNYDDHKAWLDSQLASGQISQAQYDDGIRALTAITQAGETGGPSPGALPGPSAVDLDQAGMYGPNGKLAATDPTTYKMMQMHLGALGLQAYRPAMEQSRLNALQNQLGAYKPMNNALTSMYGPGAALDLTARSPLAPGQTRIGAPNVNDIGLQNPTAPGGPASYMGSGPRGVSASAAAPTTYPTQNPAVYTPPSAPPGGQPVAPKTQTQAIAIMRLLQGQ